MSSRLSPLATSLLAAAVATTGCAGTGRERLATLANSPATLQSGATPASLQPIPSVALSTKQPITQTDVALAAFEDRDEASQPAVVPNFASSAMNATLFEVEEPQIFDQTFTDPIITLGSTPTVVSGSMALEDFQSLALQNNPSIAELVATTQKAAGYRNQVGLRANPFVGYNATQLADQGTDQHTVFISQTIITADKLALNRRVLNEALRSQLLELEAQKYRVATDVRVKFYEALATQQQMQLIRDFQSIAEKGVELAELRKQAGEGSQLDVVQAKVQQNEIDLARQQAEANFQGAWRELVALIGSTELLPVTLQGELPKSDAAVDWNVLASSIIASSPEYRAAEVRVAQARANLQRQCVQKVPNLNVNFGAGVDNGTNSGMMNLQIGAPLPVFNQNQGNVAAARAELTRATREQMRIENSIKARVGAISSTYNASLAAVEKYSSGILPNANEGLELAEIAYQAGETSFVQVLVARRTYFDSNLQFLEAQTQLAQSRAQVDGFVLTGSLDSVSDNSGDSSLRDLTLSQE